MKAVAFHPGVARGEVIALSDDQAIAFAAMQKLVGGWLEVVPMGRFDVYCNEDGLSKKMPPNRRLPDGRLLVGPIVVLRRSGSDLAGLSDDEAAEVLRGGPVR